VVGFVDGGSKLERGRSPGSSIWDGEDMVTRFCVERLLCFESGIRIFADLADALREKPGDVCESNGGERKLDPAEWKGARWQVPVTELLDKVGTHLQS